MKTFVVPKEIGRHLFFDYSTKTPVCAVGHLQFQLDGVPNDGMASKWEALAYRLAIPIDTLNDLSQKNDIAGNGEPRRQVLLSWLRTHFPDQEINIKRDGFIDSIRKIRTIHGCSLTEAHEEAVRLRAIEEGK